MGEWLIENWTEVVGFGTGAACVWLAARRNIWTFPLGIANNLVFIVLFFGPRFTRTSACRSSTWCSG